jgi:Spy/CpxP family protein refolding chaperone
MFIHSKFAAVSLTIPLIIFGGTALGQQPQQNNNVGTGQPNPQTRRMMMRRRGMRGAAHAFQQLNLTDQQKQQLRSIIQTQFQTTQAQRQELRQLAQKRRTGTLTAEETTRATELRQQLRQSRQAVRSQMIATLTPEQKTQLETMIKTRRENRGKFAPKKQPFI